MSSVSEEASHATVVEAFADLESLFLEVEVSTTGSLPLMKRGALHRPAVRLVVEFSLGMSPGQEGIVLRNKRQTEDFWSQQKQAHIDYQAHLLARPDSPDTESDQEESGPGASVSTE